MENSLLSRSGWGTFSHNSSLKGDSWKNGVQHDNLFLITQFALLCLVIIDLASANIGAFAFFTIKMFSFLFANIWGVLNSPQFVETLAASTGWTVPSPRFAIGVIQPRLVEVDPPFTSTNGGMVAPYMLHRRQGLEPGTNLSLNPCRQTHSRPPRACCVDGVVLMVFQQCIGVISTKEGFQK